MRIFIALVFFFAGSFSTYAQNLSSSRVYSCDFTDQLSTAESLRMKEYFDPEQNLKLGKVDFMRSSQVVESSLAKVYQIQLWEQEIYLQIWDAKNIRVDAQMSLTSSNHTFLGVYNNGSLQRQIFCTNLN